MNYKNDEYVPKGVIISDLASCCEQKCAISNARERDKWSVIPYKTATICGKMLSAFETVSPDSLKIKVNLKGWHKIYVSLLNNTQNNRVFLKLTNDRAPSTFHPGSEVKSWWQWESFVESFWKCADMTGQSIELIKKNGAGLCGSHIAWLRFVPMTEDEIISWKSENQRTDTKRIFATNDMFSLHVMESPNTENDWLTLVENLKYSDVEILSLEDKLVLNDHKKPHNENDTSYLNDIRKALRCKVQTVKKSDYSSIINYAHESGIKVYLSQRMGVSSERVFPYDVEQYGDSFAQEHSELCCKNRDGSNVDALSFAYSEVQQYLIDKFVKMADFDCDGITLIYTRGIPYLLFEEPTVALFGQRYADINPCELPLTDSRLNAVHCEIMTEFMRKLRGALDDVCKAKLRRRMAIHVYVGTSIADNRMIGIDVETWAKEGLIDSFSAYPLKLRERLEDVMQKENPDRIDLAAYQKKARESFHKIVHRYVEYDKHIEPEHVEEYVKIAKKFGVKAYFDLLPRNMSDDMYIESATLLEKYGAENFSLWDCNVRCEVRSSWAVASRLGHTENIRNGTLMKNSATMYRILSINESNIGVYNPAWEG